MWNFACFALFMCAWTHFRNATCTDCLYIAHTPHKRRSCDHPFKWTCTHVALAPPHNLRHPWFITPGVRFWFMHILIGWEDHRGYHISQIWLVHQCSDAVLVFRFSTKKLKIYYSLANFCSLCSGWVLLWPDGR